MRTALLLSAVTGIAMWTPVSQAADNWFTLDRPVYAADGQPESVYAPPAPPREDEGINGGGVNFDLAIRYVTDYVYRGVDRGEFLGRLPDKLGTDANGKKENVPGPLDASTKFSTGAEDRPNFQVDAKMSFDLGKFPHPYIGVFVNIFNADPLSRFQEVRPFFGIAWQLKPFLIDIGHTTYILPEREYANTSELYARLTLDDRRLFHSERPVLSPYIFAAYDYDIYDGLYVEAGITHDFLIEDWGLTITTYAHAAYVVNNDLYQETVDGRRTGFQHYELGVIGRYSLNNALNISKRYGDFALEGFVTWTDQLDSELRADPQLSSGAGIVFRY